MFFEDELIALRDQNKAHAEALQEDPNASQSDLFSGISPAIVFPRAVLSFQGVG